MFVEFSGALLTIPVQSTDYRSAAALWPARKRVVFRFIFFYLLFYNLPFPLGNWPIDGLASPIDDSYSRIWDALVPWVAKHGLHVGYEILWRPNGSADTTYNWVQNFCFLILAVAAACVWSLADRQSKAHPRLFRFLHSYIRYYLAWALLRYGALKVGLIQFPSPGLDRLVQPFGDASPLSLIWTFMGSSATYNIFGGVAEMLAGALLVFPRTALLGSLVSIAVMLNVVALNFSYDVPVKQYSVHLLAMSVFLAAPHLQELWNFFVRHRPAEPFDLYPGAGTGGWFRYANTIRALCMAAVIGAMFLLHSKPVPSPLRGVWSVDEFQMGSQSRPASAERSGRWQRVIIDGSVIAIQDSSGIRRYALRLDAGNGTLEIHQIGQPVWAAFQAERLWKTTFSFDQPDRNQLKLYGALDGYAVEAVMHRLQEPPFILNSRGFHWINEYSDFR